MMILLPFSILACGAAGALAVPTASSSGSEGLHLDRRFQRWTNWRVTLNAPSGSTGDVFEMSVDNGVSWQANARNMPLGPQSTVGFRRKDDPDSAFIAKNTLPSGVTHWLTEESGGSPYNLGLYDNDASISVDFSKSPAEPVTPAQSIPIPMSADVLLENAGRCDPGDYTATVFFKDGSAPQVYHTVYDEEIEDTAMEFHIDEFHRVSNVTLSFGTGTAVYPGPNAPLVAQYASAQKAPLITSNVHIFGGFCDNDD